VPGNIVLRTAVLCEQLLHLVESKMNQVDRDVTHFTEMFPA
jgi:hypothetical protein